jgi:hypothetical protein
MFTKLFGSNPKSEFWKWFIKHQEELFHFESNQDSLFNQLGTKLKNVNPNLVFEFGPIRNGMREFCISADGIKDVFPAVIDLIEKAPDLPNWEFYSFRQRVPGDSIVIKMGDVELGYDDIYFRYGEDEGGEKMGIELNIRNYDPEKKVIKSAAFILLDGMIGEYDMETRISWIDFVKLDEENIEQLYPLVKLRDLVDLLKV